ncbi:putative nicotinate-nucleotide adenylyltransferase [Mycoplasmopsis synoviae]|uniref:Putative nicotinate-nucleotide adenylyltransferase n=1 Tax=Mycoplasmopsis synoviae TaxID=2109 RepID=A0A3B0PHI7_MYCSY|nr:putative nicotinate-nucleotide adenylyltransferase [Mycoplasmopsis synoviae]
MHAVRIHTNLDDRSKQKISLFDKVIFVSDKICQGRKFAGVQKLRKIVFENFEEGFKEVIKHVIKFNEDKGVVFSDRQIKIYEGLLK